MINIREVSIMYTIKAKPITVENFKAYGTFASMLNPTGPSLGDFYNDQVEFPVSGNLPIAFSPLVVRKGEMLVTQAEYHDTTCEGVLPLDDDVVLHVAPATKEPVPELTEAFIVPKGTMVKLNVGVWHLAAMPIHLDTAHVMITLPERIYKSDCVVVEYPPEQYVKIEL